MAFATINKGASYFNPVLWTGNGTGARAITGVNFQPDLVWLKTRSTAFHPQLHDKVRGATAGALYSSLTNAEDPNYPITSFDSDGFTLGNSASLIADSFGSQNYNGTTMCSWNWLAANSTTSNTQGTITSTVSANTTSGFSIIKFTASGSGNQSVGHGLGVTPKMFITKATSTTSGWNVYHASLSSSSPQDYYLNLNLTNASTNLSAVWGAGMTSSVCGIGVGVGVSSGVTYIGYAFAEVKGFSKFGSYTGNGSSDGTFVYTGFKPSLILQKTTSTTSDWNIVDNKRSTYNVNNLRLNPNTSSVESTSPDYCDLLSNGFKFRASSSGINGSGETNIYAAFAENPFVLTDGTPVTAR